MVYCLVKSAYWHTILFTWPTDMFPVALRLRNSTHLHWFAKIWVVWTTVWTQHPNILSFWRCGVLEVLTTFLANVTFVSGCKYEQTWLSEDMWRWWPLFPVLNKGCSQKELSFIPFHSVPVPSVPFRSVPSIIPFIPVHSMSFLPCTSFYVIHSM